MGIQSLLPSAIAFRTLAPIKNDIDLKVNNLIVEMFYYTSISLFYLKIPSHDGSVYDAGPSVCMWHTLIPSNFLLFPTSVIASRRVTGVAAAPCE